MRKKIIYLLGGVALVILIVVFTWLISSGRIKPFAAGAGGSLSLSPSSGTITVGQLLTVSIIANSAGQEITGVDVRFLHYNTGDLELQGQIQKGSIFPSYPTASADTNAGTISISGTILGGEAQKAVSGVLATMTFKALKAATTQLTFDYDPANPGKTSDTNMVQNDGSGNIGDILEQATGGTYTLQAAVVVGPTPTPTPASAPGGRIPPTPTPTSTPATPAETQPTPEEVAAPTEETPTVSEPGAEETSGSVTTQTQTPNQVVQASPGATASPTVSPKTSSQASPKTSSKTSPTPLTKLGGFSISPAMGILLYIGLPVLVTLIVFFIWQKYRKRKSLVSPKPKNDDEDELI